MILDDMCEFDSQYLIDHKIYTPVQRLAHRLGFGIITGSISEKQRAHNVDNLARVMYSLAVGAGLELYAGQSLGAIVASRTVATGINAATGNTFSRWREYVFEATKTSSESSFLRCKGIDYLAMTSFETVVLTASMASGSLLNDGEINCNVIGDGIKAFWLMSVPIIYGMGTFVDWFGKHFFNVDPAMKRVNQE